MPYTTTVTVLDTEGGSLTMPITARLWQTWGVLGQGTGTGNQQSDRRSVDVEVPRDLSAPATIAFDIDGNFAPEGREAALSVQDTNRVANDTGWLFRSGGYAQDVPSDPVEIVTASQTLTNADVAGALPAVPFTVDAGTGTVLTAITTTISTAGIDVVATGTTNAAGPTVGLTLTTTLLVSPSADVRHPHLEAVTVGMTNPAVTFAPGSNVLSTVSAAVLNTLSGFLVSRVRPAMQARLESMVNAGILARVGGAVPGGTLPEGVILSIRSVTIRTPAGGAATIEIRGALGAFGGVVSKVVPAGSTSKGRFGCFVATAVRGERSADVELLRRYRDTVLLTHATGRAFVAGYGIVGPWLAALIERSPALRGAADRLIVRPGVAVARARLRTSRSSISSRRTRRRASTRAQPRP